MIIRVNDWRDVVQGRRYNWQEFRLVAIQFERDNVCRTIDATIVLFGLGIKASWYAPDLLFPTNGTRDRALDLAETLSE